MNRFHQPPAGSRSIRADVGELRTAVDDSSRLVRNVTFTFLLAWLYVAILGGQITHEILLRGETIALPLLNVGVSVVWAFGLAPVLLLLLHFNLLLQFHFLAQKVEALNDELKLLPEDESARARLLLFPLPFTQLSAGTGEQGLLRWLLALMVWISLVALPLAALLWVQIRFLPYQHDWITPLHQLCVILDAALIIAIWPRSRRPSRGWLPNLRRSLAEGAGQRMAVVSAFAASAIAVLVSVVLLPNRGSAWDTSPLQWFWVPVSCDHFGEAGRWECGPLDASRLRGRDDGRLQRLVRELAGNGASLAFAPVPPDPDEAARFALASVQDLLFDGPDWMAPRTLRVPERSFLARPPAPEIVAQFRREADPEARDEGGRLAYLDPDHTDPINLSGRNLRRANLAGATVIRALLGGADLQGASLWGADLQGADLRRADLQGADLGLAALQGASLWGADLQGADLGWADLQGADLVEADLQGADLRGADLQGASLSRADLQGVSLFRADLQGADLRAARLWRAQTSTDTNLSLADLRDASVDPPEEGEVSALMARIREVVDSGEILERVLARLGPLAEPPLDQPTPDVLLQAKLTDVRTRDFDPRYDALLSEFLIGLACAEGASKYRALGLARRFLGVFWRLEFPEQGSIFAETLLGEDCVGGRALDEEQRQQLREIAERDDSAARQDPTSSPTSTRR